MTYIDPGAELEFQRADEHVTVRIALAGPVPDEWRGQYRDLAFASGIPAHAETGHDRTRIVVQLPGGTGERQLLALLDAACGLVAEADAATWPVVPARTEATVRAWWARRARSEARRLAGGTSGSRSGLRAEPWWPMAATLAVALAIPLVLPPRFGLDLRWVFSAVTGLLLLAVLTADRGRSYRKVTSRSLCLGIVVLLIGDASWLTVRLIADLLDGGPETNNAAALLRIGFLVWLYMIIGCAFLYWALDSGGPAARAFEAPEFPDLAFPEQVNPGVARPGWRPEFSDYLYLAFTNSTAFSPTDVMPLARWAKLAMTVQAAGSLAILGLVIAGAVNILK